MPRIRTFELISQMYFIGIKVIPYLYIAMVGPQKRTAKKRRKEGKREEKRARMASGRTSAVDGSTI